ncbi:MAG: hypothetical protein PHU68_01290 [Paludibacter sp.]|nr:hypothetical protein [Paludibacter sp.]
MIDTTPSLMQAEEYNKLVKNWTLKTRSKFQHNAPVSGSGNNKTRALRPSIDSSTKRYGKEIGKIRFGFEKHGVYIHYGVGRGYIRNGNAVVRGSKNNENVISQGFKRRPNDWFDVEIKKGIRELSLIAQEYYGDWAMNKLLQQIDKATIQKK